MNSENEIENWEKELREKLEKELPEGAYEVKIGLGIMYTGKQGKIESEIGDAKFKRILVDIDKICNYFSGK